MKLKLFIMFYMYALTVELNDEIYTTTTNMIILWRSYV